MEGIKYFDLVFCPDPQLTKPDICAEFVLEYANFASN